MRIQRCASESMTSVQLLNVAIGWKKAWVGPNDKQQGDRLLTSMRQSLTLRRRDMLTQKQTSLPGKGEEGTQRQNIA